MTALRRTLLLLAALALLAASCGPARRRPPVVVGALYPLAGSQGAGGHGRAVAGRRPFLRRGTEGAHLGAGGKRLGGRPVPPRLPVKRQLRYAVAYVDDVYGRAVGSGALVELRAGGQALAGSFPYDAHAGDFAPLATRIAASRPDVLFVAAYLDDAVAMRRSLVAAHAPPVTGIGTSSSYCMPAFGETLGANAVGLFASDKPDAAAVRVDALSPEGRATLAWAQARYRARYHEAMSAPALSGFSNA